jgi:hypothetical protein
MAKFNHVRPTEYSMPPSRSVMPEVGSESTQIDSSCLQLPATHQHVPEWPKSIMFGPQHAPATQSCLKWAQNAPRVPPAACHKIHQHVPEWPKSIMFGPQQVSGRSVMPEVGCWLGKDQETGLPYTICHHTTTCARMIMFSPQHTQQISHA